MRRETWRLRRERSEVTRELTLRLRSLDELFSPPELGLSGSANVATGIERLLGQIKATHGHPRLRATILVPVEQIVPGSEAQLRDGVARYCALRESEVSNERSVLRYDGLSALWIGVPLLLAGLFLSTVARHSGLPEFVRSSFADGLLLVISWVALWYPLDTLIYYGRPHARELRALRQLRHMELDVRPDEHPLAHTYSPTAGFAGISERRS